MRAPHRDCVRSRRELHNKRVFSGHYMKILSCGRDGFKMGSSKRISGEKRFQVQNAIFQGSSDVVAFRKLRGVIQGGSSIGIWMTVRKRLSGFRNEFFSS